MRVLITGANGFLGRTLTQRLLAEGSLRGRRIDTLILLDKTLTGFPEDARIRLHPVDVTEPALLRRALADGVDVVFHLISIPGGAAEDQYSLGYQVNLESSLELLQQLRGMRCVPVFVYASSVAVYGSDLPAHMNERFPPCPAFSYGAHTLMVETALTDLTRRGELDGRALRLPGIVARPGRESNGLRSAFMSDLMHAVANGKPYRCPVSPQATAWWMSVLCCVDNLIHAAQLNDPGPQRVWQSPVLQLSIGQVLDALLATFGQERRGLIEFGPDEGLEGLFGRFPPLRTPQARALGFRHDGNAAALVRNVLMPAARAGRGAERTCTIGA